MISTPDDRTMRRGEHDMERSGAEIVFARRSMVRPWQVALRNGMFAAAIAAGGLAMCLLPPLNGSVGWTPTRVVLTVVFSLAGLVCLFLPIRYVGRAREDAVTLTEETVEVVLWGRRGRYPYGDIQAVRPCGDSRSHDTELRLSRRRCLKIPADVAPFAPLSEAIRAMIEVRPASDSETPLHQLEKTRTGATGLGSNPVIAIVVGTIALGLGGIGMWLMIHGFFYASLFMIVCAILIARTVSEGLSKTKGFRVTR